MKLLMLMLLLLLLLVHRLLLELLRQVHRLLTRGQLVRGLGLARPGHKATYTTWGLARPRHHATYNWIWQRSLRLRGLLWLTFGG